MMMAQGWLLLSITNSPLIVGLAPALGSAAMMFSSPWGGVLSDRLNRRTILIFAQSTITVTAFSLGILTILNLIEVRHILVAAVIDGISRGFQNPARSTLMFDLVGRTALINAAAGQMMAFQVASILGPMLGGIIMSSFGVGTLFLLVGFSFLISVLLIFRVSSSPPNLPPAKSALASLKEGLSFAIRDKAIRAILWTFFITQSLSFSTWTMFPVITRDNLQAGPIVLGLISTLQGCGGVAGGLIISGIGDVKNIGRLFFVASIASGCFMILFALSRNIYISLFLITLSGLCGTTFMILSGTLIQKISPAEMRGRLMGLHSLLMSGIGLGGLIMGSIATLWGVTTAIVSGSSIATSHAITRIPQSSYITERSNKNF